MKFILKALDKDGNVMFYTGKAGMSWLSYERKEAFSYKSITVALAKATNFNHMEPVHGYWFLAIRNRQYA